MRERGDLLGWEGMESSAPKEHRQFIHNNRKKAEFVAQVQAVHKGWWELVEILYWWLQFSQWKRKWVDQLKEKLGKEVLEVWWKRRYETMVEKMGRAWTRKRWGNCLPAERAPFKVMVANLNRDQPVSSHNWLSRCSHRSGRELEFCQGRKTKWERAPGVKGRSKGEIIMTNDESRAGPGVEWWHEGAESPWKGGRINRLGFPGPAPDVGVVVLGEVSWHERRFLKWRLNPWNSTYRKALTNKENPLISMSFKWSLEVPHAWDFYLWLFPQREGRRIELLMYSWELWIMKLYAWKQLWEVLLQITFHSPTNPKHLGEEMRLRATWVICSRTLHPVIVFVKHFEWI